MLAHYQPDQTPSANTLLHSPPTESSTLPTANSLLRSSKTSQPETKGSVHRHGYEDDRVEGCPVLVKLNSALSDLGWVELRCPICLANCSDDLVFFLGIIGIQCHMSKKHEMTPTNKSDFSHKSIVEKGVLRTHSEDIIDKFRAAMANDRQDPIERFQGCFPDAAQPLLSSRSYLSIYNTPMEHSCLSWYSTPLTTPNQICGIRIDGGGHVFKSLTLFSFNL